MKCEHKFSSQAASILERFVSTGKVRYLVHGYRLLRRLSCHPHRPLRSQAGGSAQRPEGFGSWSKGTSSPLPRHLSHLRSCVYAIRSYRQSNGVFRQTEVTVKRQVLGHHESIIQCPCGKLCVTANSPQLSQLFPQVAALASRERWKQEHMSRVGVTAGSPLLLRRTHCENQTIPFSAPPLTCSLRAA